MAGEGEPGFRARISACISDIRQLRIGRRRGRRARGEENLGSSHPSPAGAPDVQLVKDTADPQQQQQPQPPPTRAEGKRGTDTSDPWMIPSRRSVVYSTRGMVACTQPLAATCGLEILRKGGNAADAAVAVAAGLNVTEPVQTGIGGDMFLLYRDAATGTISALNGSGRSGRQYTLERIRRELGLRDGDHESMLRIPSSSALSVTVPGAAAGWVDTVERFGSGQVTLAEVLAPATALAEEGFPVSEITGQYWQRLEPRLRAASPNYAEMLKRDPLAASPDRYRAPGAGEIMANPTLARTFRSLAASGKAGYYTGRIAEEIVAVCRDRGGLLELDDLRHHMDQDEDGIGAAEPISLTFTGMGLGPGRGLTLWEHPPNGQGIVALMALGMFQAAEARGAIPTFAAQDHNTIPYLHAIIEVLRLAFADASWFVADAADRRVPTAELVTMPYLEARARLFDPTRALDSDQLVRGDPAGKKPAAGGGGGGGGIPSPALASSDTVYFCVVDSHGNAASFINSNYNHFGSDIIPRGCGFALQSRGNGFSLMPGHPNAIAPRRRPYHTIIPGMVTYAATGELHSVFGVMGGLMQPQGHLQVLLSQVVARLNPQQALDAPRICVEWEGEAGWRVLAEEGIGEHVVEGLRALGHNVKTVRGFGRDVFGRGQVIRRMWDEASGQVVWAAGSDMRGDGAAFPL